MAKNLLKLEMQRAKKAHNEELARQKVLMNEKLLPALKEIATNIYDAKSLLSLAVETMKSKFAEKVARYQEEQSKANVSELEIVAKDHDKRAIKLLEALKDERTGMVLALLNGLNVMIEAAEVKQNTKQMFADLEIKL